eukprot:TRINITY_DN0_c5760_g1_i1.p1 TRINITY_DN0_c5760_g1~~TRINITY_DN0_c5760_g1_i1.p1  ORF type:complete len:103 (+),score=17.31 TRINITY_DN0_c5760_g1_i1:1-309(+)
MCIRDRWIVGGWSTKMFPGERGRWSDSEGFVRREPDTITLPEGEGWAWDSNWSIEISRNTDADGWEYASNDFVSGFYPINKTGFLIRRRKWYRTCHKKLKTD